jgi:hypothetical protein
MAGKRLGEPAQFKTRLQFGQLVNQSKMNRWLVSNTTRRHELQGASKFDPARDSRLGVAIYIEGM